MEPDASPWRKLLDADLELGGKPASLKATLENKLLDPLVAMEAK